MKMRHATTTPPIGGAEWNEDHVAAAHSLGSISGSVSINLANGTVQTGTLTGGVTFTLPSVTAGTTEHLTLILTNAGAHSIAITGAAWVSGAAPDLDDDCIIVLRGTAAGWIADGGIYG